MDQASISLASSLYALIQRQDGIANNLANVSSTAFKRRSGTIESFRLALERADSKAATIPVFHEFGDMRQGDLRTSSDPLSLSLKGEGFFQVRKPGDPTQAFFTRDGAFVLDGDGTLKTRDGLEVLDPTGQPLQFANGETLRIGRSGDVSDEATGGIVGTVGVFRFDQPRALTGIGGGLYAPTPSSGTAQRDRFTEINQFSVERSNVDALHELVSMISVQRHFQYGTRALRVLEETSARLASLARS